MSTRFGLPPTRARRHNFSPEYLAQRLAAGAIVAEIAADHCCSEWTVRSRCVEYGIEWHVRWHSSESLRAQLTDFAAQGMPCAGQAKLLGMDVEAVRYHVRRLGLPRLQWGGKRRGFGVRMREVVKGVGCSPGVGIFDWPDGVPAAAVLRDDAAQEAA
jgi:DNA-binding CsgD family transcriptional regulator